jgi:hypothetical protein
MKIDIKLPDRYGDGASHTVAEYQSLIERYLLDILDLLNEYEHVFNWNTTDFLLKYRWNGKSQMSCDSDNDNRRRDIMPESWCKVLEALSLEDIIRIDAAGWVDETWPVGLRRIISRCHSLALPRDPSSDNITKPKQLDSLLVIGLSPKKLHEVEVMSRMVNENCAMMDSPVIVDFGAGQGYLSARLAYFGYRVLAVDFNDVQTHGSLVISERLDQVLQPARKGQLKVATVDIGRDCDVNRLVREQFQDSSDETPISIVGLHACGELTANALRIFLRTPSVKNITIVGCCYNLIEDARPMSKFMTTRQPTFVDYSTLALGGHAPWNWGKSQSTKQVATLIRRQLFRAVLQVMLYETGRFDFWNAPSDVRIGSVKKHHLKSFGVYAASAFEKLQIPLPAPEPDLNKQYERIESLTLPRLSAAISLRTLFGPIVESMVLMDRLLYIIESSKTCCLHAVSVRPIFDSQISPRNFAFTIAKALR